MNAPVALHLTLAEAETLASFLAQREQLWSAECERYAGVDPHAVARKLAQAYAAGVRRQHIASRGNCCRHGVSLEVLCDQCDQEQNVAVAVESSGGVESRHDRPAGGLKPLKAEEWGDAKSLRSPHDSGSSAPPAQFSRKRQTATAAEATVAAHEASILTPATVAQPPTETQQPPISKEERLERLRRAWRATGD